MVLWLPPERQGVRGGPPRVSNRAALAGILFVLRHGLRWRDLPPELGYGSGVTCWRRLRQWQALGVWAGLHRTLLNWLGDLGAIDWTRASLDSTSVRAKRGGEDTGPNPVDRGKAGSKFHLLVDRQGIPSRCFSQRPTCMTPSCWNPWSMPSHRFAARQDSPADRASALPSCTATKPMTSRSADGRCDSVASRLGLPAAASTRASGLVDTDGSWSVRTRGYLPSAAWP
jgi:transposase